jgi:hypothetical protein
LHEDRVWAALDYRKWGVRGLRRLRDPMFGTGPRWTRKAREVVDWAERVSGLRETTVIDTMDLLAGLAEIGDPFTEHLLNAAHVAPLDESPQALDSHLVELERSPTTQLPSFAALRRLHGTSRARHASSRRVH